MYIRFSCYYLSFHFQLRLYAIADSRTRCAYAFLCPQVVPIGPDSRITLQYAFACFTNRIGTLL